MKNHKNIFSKLVSFFKISKGKRILKENEYDIYSFELQIKKMIFERKSIKEFVVLNLEKLHPRFSNQCIWKSFFSVQNKKLLLNVIVMDKIFIANLVNCGEKRLFIENPKLQVYGSPKFCLYFLCCFFLFLVMGCTFSLLTPRKDFHTQTKLMDITNNVENLDSKFEIMEQEIPQSFLSEKDFDNLFSTVFMKNGFLTSLSYEREKDFGKLKFSFGGLLPEDLEDCFLNSLHYKKLIPQCLLEINVISYEENPIKEFQYEQNDGYRKKTPLVQGVFTFPTEEKKIIEEKTDSKHLWSLELIKFRNHLISKGIFPKEEDLVNGKLFFEVPKDKVESVFESYFELSSLDLDKFSISSNREDSNLVFNFYFPMKDAFANLNLLFSKSFFSLISKGKKNLSLTRQVTQNPVQKDINYEILGKIKDSNGEKLLIRTDEGKILIKNQIEIK